MPAATRSRLPADGARPAPAKFAGRGPKAERTRERIIAAAGRVVGEEGYPSASIAKITKAAGISNGSFYYYYVSREQLFDDLLPALGKDMVDFIVARVEHLPWGLEREMAGFSAYFDYIDQAKHFPRVFTEAQVYAPAAYQTHLQWIIDNFVIGLERQVRRGHLNVEGSDLMALAYTLTGIRNHATQMLRASGDEGRAHLASAFKIYRAMLAGLFGRPDGGERR